MFGAESQRQAFEPEFNPPPPEPKKEGELDEPEKKTEPAKIYYPFGRPGEQKKAESLEEGFCRQDFELISKSGEVVATFYRGFPTKVIPKGGGGYEVLEKKPAGNIVSKVFEKVDEIKFG